MMSWDGWPDRGVRAELRRLYAVHWMRPPFPRGRFLEFWKVVDTLQSFTIFTSVRQGRDEDVASYTKPVLTFGQNAYGDKREKDDTVKAQALAVYMEGLRSRKIKTRIFRAEVTTLTKAIEMAKSDDMRSPWT